MGRIADILGRFKERTGQCRGEMRKFAKEIESNSVAVIVAQENSLKTSGNSRCSAAQLDSPKDLITTTNNGRLLIMIPFNKPPYTGNEDQHILSAMRSAKISGDGEYSKRCQTWFETKTGSLKALLTPSCTHALEMAAILINIQPGDEVIMSSYTFVSTANAFVLRGARIVFVDIRPDTLNINENLVEDAITSKTKAIVAVHYAGVACEMDTLMEIAKRRGIFVIEDAAQGMMSTYRGRQLGSIGHLGTYSFHETKNYTSGGEGGLLLINDDRFVRRSEIIREKGTNRSQFFRGMTDKYSWVDIGSSYLPSDIQAAYLWGQIEKSEDINLHRLKVWDYYYDALAPLSRENHVALPSIPNDCVHNAHIFHLRVRDIAERGALLQHLIESGIFAVFHYVPLHSAPAGLKYSRFHGKDFFTTTESERIVRLPIWYGISLDEVQTVIESVFEFYA